MKLTRSLNVLALAMLVGSQALAADPAKPAVPATPLKPAAPAQVAKPAVPANAPKTSETTPRVAAEVGDVHHQFRASTIESMRVYNPAGDELGSVKDLVIDMQSGKVLYAALDFGGFLGIGDKLFAVPWHAFTIGHGKDGKDRHLVLDITKDRLKTAPGFDKAHWPDTADPTWTQPVDQFYGPQKTTAAVVQ